MAKGKSSGRLDVGNPSGMSGRGGDDYGYTAGNAGKHIAKAMPNAAPQCWLDRHELQHSDYSEVTGGASTINE